jgi:hypothetical protein
VTSSDSAQEDIMIVDENKAYAAVEMTMNDNNTFAIRQHHPLKSSHLMYDYVDTN